jgi:hypothetical protein
MAIKLKNVLYNFNNGPLTEKELKKDNFKEGNCRLAVQYYFYKIHNLYLKPSSILNPRAYEKVGRFIIKEGEFSSGLIEKIQEGDIIYGDRIGAKKDRKISRKDWIVGLHSAIYAGNNRIWHSVKVAGESCYWSFNKFLKYYNLVAVKRIL